ncbi:DNA binding protein [Pantoea sp. Tr-811]|uniref:histone-like nucleoid-structuring protein, MvaT/MvaU family n=1 Tax=Pantoea sp. Tr-811 TaxID=2608361 RepID=UPI00141F78ED|nr:histone-like nucleoid-structuring protein, MvaT/MvaU family [Pantoea sp. Tr-811]NIF29748.1 DNA binding protein [Pantoea sp. Tr-811]
MSTLAEYRHLEKQLNSKLQALEALKVHPKLQRELEFEQKLRHLLADYDYSAQKIVSLYLPAVVPSPQPLAAPQPKRPRKPRQAKHYRNPYTGEVAITKGGNHKVLKAWKRQYGPLEVESWVSQWS